MADSIPYTFYPHLVSVARRLEVRPLDLLMPLYNESGLHHWAHNPQGNAAGIFQAMPAILQKVVHFPGTWEAFIQLDADEQLVWLEAYYRPHRGKLVSATAVYMATFCPAWIRHAGEPHFIICARDGRSDGGLAASISKLWFSQNRGLDKNGDGAIEVADLTAAIEAACVGPRWEAIRARIENEERAAPTLPPSGPDLRTPQGLQLALGRLGYDVGPADGAWGPRSIAACRAFQVAQGLTVDGVVGDETRAELGAELAAKG